MEAQEGVLRDPITAYQNTSLYVLLVLQLKECSRWPKYIISTYN